MYVLLNPLKKTRNLFFKLIFSFEFTVRASHNIRVLSTELDKIIFENIKNSAE